jgi:hypothetical protein
MVTMISRATVRDSAPYRCRLTSYGKMGLPDGRSGDAGPHGRPEQSDGRGSTYPSQTIPDHQATDRPGDELAGSANRGGAPRRIEARHLVRLFPVIEDLGVNCTRVSAGPGDPVIKDCRGSREDHQIASSPLRTSVMSGNGNLADAEESDLAIIGHRDRPPRPAIIWSTGDGLASTGSLPCRC